MTTPDEQAVPVTVRKLWLLLPVKAWRPAYDKTHGVVVRAKTEEEARRLASLEAGDEGAGVWLKASKTTCVELTADGESETILVAYTGA